MATQPSGNLRRILTQIVQQIGDLSQTLMSDHLRVVNNGNLASNNTLEEELRSVFNGHRANSKSAVSSRKPLKHKLQMLEDNCLSHRLIGPVEIHQHLCTLQEVTLITKELP